MRAGATSVANRHDFERTKTLSRCRNRLNIKSETGVESRLQPFVRWRRCAERARPGRWPPDAGPLPDRGAATRFAVATNSDPEPGRRPRSRPGPAPELKNFPCADRTRLACRRELVRPDFGHRAR